MELVGEDTRKSCYAPRAQNYPTGRMNNVNPRNRLGRLVLRRSKLCGRCKDSHASRLPEEAATKPPALRASCRRKAIDGSKDCGTMTTKTKATVTKGERTRQKIV